MATDSCRLSTAARAGGGDTLQSSGVAGAGAGAGAGSSSPASVSAVSPCLPPASRPEEEDTSDSLDLRSAVLSCSADTAATSSLLVS